MSFLKSSTKSSLHDMKYSFRTLLPVPIFLCAFLFFTVTFFGYTTLREITHFSEMKISDFRYIFISVDYSSTADSLLIQFGLYLAGILAALMAFKFVNNKKSTNLFLSLNVTRTKLFTNRCIASLSYLAAAVLLPMTVSLIMSLRKFGFNYSTINAWVYLVFGMFSCVFVSFAISAIAMFASGSAFEGTLYSFIFIAAPTMIFAGFEFVCRTLLVGYPAVSTFVSHVSTDYFSRNEGMFLRTNLLNPLFFFDNIGKSNAMTNGISNYGSYKTADKFVMGFDQILPVALWFAIGVVCLFFANWLLNRRKAENAGSFGKNKVSRTIAVSLVSIFVFTVALSIFVDYSLVTAMLIASAAALIFYIIVDLVILRDLREFGRGLIKLPFIAAFIAAMVLIPATGGFGFEDRIPEISEIDYVIFDGPVTDNLFFWTGQNVPTRFTGEGDKKLAGDIHKQIIEASRKTKYSYMHHDGNISAGSFFTLRYQLKNGGNISRRYTYASDINREIVSNVLTSNYSQDILTKALTLNDTEISDKFNALYEEFKGKQDIYYGYSRNRTLTDKDYEYTLYTAFSAFRYTESNTSYCHVSDIEAVSADPYTYNEKTGEQIRNIVEGKINLSEKLSAEEFAEFKKCMLNDYKKIGFDKIYSPAAETIGLVIFGSNDEKLNDIQFRGYYTISMFEGAPNTFFLPVSADMSETMSFLKAHDIKTQPTLEIKKPVFAAYSMVDDINYQNKYWDLFYMHFSDQRYALTNDNSPGRPPYASSIFITNFGKAAVNMDVLKTGYAGIGMTIIEDKAMIDKLYAKVQSFGLTSGDGYFVQFVYDDGTLMNCFVSSDKMPK